MADKLTPQQRHKCMSRIKGRDTKPEMLVRRWLWHDGWRYRLCVKGFPGRPDLVIRRIKTVIFVNGCFWHGHNVVSERVGESPAKVHEFDADMTSFELTDSGCCKIPHTNRAFWIRKITTNRLRDYRNYSVYIQAGWRVLVVWECMLKPKTRTDTLRALSHRLNTIFLESLKKPKEYAFEREDACGMVAE
ncbi:MAG: very short patch repair endonuclease [Bacteroidaceae bacterium]|nr:very short patch repair endonuclease [Bacteroidaceae bacterium]